MFFACGLGGILFFLGACLPFGIYDLLRLSALFLINARTRSDCMCRSVRASYFIYCIVGVILFVLLHVIQLLDSTGGGCCHPYINCLCANSVFSGQLFYADSLPHTYTRRTERITGDSSSCNFDCLAVGGWQLVLSKNRHSPKKERRYQ